MRVTLRPRPWLQALDGTVSPDPHRTLARLVRASPSTFTMAAGSRRTVRLTLRRHPSGGSLYGGLDLSGVPRGARLPNGITPALPADRQPPADSGKDAYPRPRRAR